MGIMSFLRNRAGVILVAAIGLAIIAFLIGDAVRFGGPMGMSNQTTVGEVAGEEIDIQSFNARVEQNSMNFRQQMGQSSLSPQMTSYIVENSWNQAVGEILMNKEIERLGLTVSRNELNDMISGKNPSPQVVQSFGDPQTGQINREQLNNFLTNIESQPASSPIRQQWGSFLLSLKQDRLSQKYFTLVRNSVYVTSLEAREDYAQRNKLADFDYVSLAYSTIPDDKAVPQNKDYQDYYNQHKNRFKNNEETRSFKYVLFDAAPTAADSAAVKKTIEELAEEFRKTSNDSLFVSINSETKAPIRYVKKGELDPALDELVFNASQGSVVGPVLSNGVYEMAKVLDSRMSPDSVKARHILINPASEGGLDKAKAKADSIANLIRNGKSFSELAAEYGTDASKDKGGDLGTFARGAMIPEFEEAVFNAKPGDLKVVTTQFGVHVVRIDSQKGSSRVVKAAVVDKPIVSSDKTQQEAYAKARTFLSAVSSDAGKFEEQAKKQGLQVLTADHIAGSQQVPGLDNARELVRWVFKADEGDVADEIFELDSRYAVAKVTEIRKKGILPLEKVKNEIEPFVRNEVKARMLKEKFAGVSSLQQAAQKAGSQVNSVQNVVFANPMIPGIGLESKVVGNVFGMQPGKLSKPIAGEQGVYLVSVKKFTNPAPLTNVYKQKQQMNQMLDQRVQGETFQALREKAEVKDYRVRFF